MSDTNKSLIQEFTASFQTARLDLSTRLESLKIASVISNEALNALTLDAARLRKALTDATSFLPTYDQRQYEQFLKSMEQSLEELRSASAPKPKFTFKRRAREPLATTAQHAAAVPAPHEGPVRVSVQALEAQSSYHLSLSGYSHKYLSWSSLPPSLSSTSDLSISDLSNCIVNLLATPSTASVGRSTSGEIRTFTALHIRNLVDTVLILPPINGSALIHDLKHCTIVLGCHQFRMHTSSAVNIYLSIASNPIIEHCSAIQFSQYPDAFQLDVPATSSTWAVQDFSHIRPTPSPNWSKLPDDKKREDWSVDEQDGDADVDAVLPRFLPQSKFS